MSVVNYFKIEFDFDNTIIIPDFACPKKYFWFSSVFRKSNLWIKVSVVNIFNETFRFLEKFTIIINIYLNWLYKNYLVLLFIKVPSKTKNLFKMVGYNYFFLIIEGHTNFYISNFSQKLNKIKFIWIFIKGVLLVLNLFCQMVSHILHLEEFHMLNHHLDVYVLR